MLLEVLNNVPAYFLINCGLLREGFRASQMVCITNSVIVSSVVIMRVDFTCGTRSNVWIHICSVYL